MTAEQKQQLDEQGYVVLPDLMDADFLSAAQRRVDELYEQEGDASGSEFKQEPQSKRLANVVNKGEIFLRVINTPEVLECMAHVLGPKFKLSSLNVRSADPHSDWVQPLHIDGGGLPDEKGYYVCNSIWILDDFTTENGATRLIPGSHRWNQKPTDVLADLTAHHPQEILMTGKGRNRGGDEFSSLARRHGQSHCQAAQGDSRLLHTQRQTTAALSEEVSGSGLAKPFVASTAQPPRSG